MRGDLDRAGSGARPFRITGFQPVFRRKTRVENPCYAKTRADVGRPAGFKTRRTHTIGIRRHVILSEAKDLDRDHVPTRPSQRPRPFRQSGGRVALGRTAP